MRQCQSPKCNRAIPLRAWIQGKKRNLQHRKYCFTCSPFGHHNTRKLGEKTLAQTRKLLRECKCGRNHHRRYGSMCPACRHRKRQTACNAKIYSVVGEACWICGYNRTRRNLCFHHVNPATKLFCLTTREMMLKWTRVCCELQKCILVCANCHGEIHDNLIDYQVVKRLHRNEWSKRSKHLLALTPQV